MHTNPHAHILEMKQRKKKPICAQTRKIRHNNDNNNSEDIKKNQWEKEMEEKNGVCIQVICGQLPKKITYSRQKWKRKRKKKHTFFQMKMIM